MADIDRLFDVDEHYVITSEVAQVNQSSVSPLQAYAVGTVMGQSLASPYAFELSSDGASKVAQPASTTHPHKASNRVARPSIVRAVALNIPVPTLTFKPYTVNVPLFNFGKDKNYIKKIEDLNSRLEDNMFNAEKEAYRKGAEDAESRFTGVTSDIRRREMVGTRYPQFTGMKAIKAQLGEGAMTWGQLKASSSMLEANKEFAKYYKEMALSERGKQKELKSNLQTAAGNVFKLTRIQDVKNAINDSLQGRLFNAEKQLKYKDNLLSNSARKLQASKIREQKLIVRVSELQQKLQVSQGWIKGLRRQLDRTKNAANIANKKLDEVTAWSLKERASYDLQQKNYKKLQMQMMFAQQKQQAFVAPPPRDMGQSDVGGGIIQYDIAEQQVEASRKHKLQTTMSRKARRIGY